MRAVLTDEPPPPLLPPPSNLSPSLAPSFHLLLWKCSPLAPFPPLSLSLSSSRPPSAYLTKKEHCSDSREMFHCKDIHDGENSEEEEEEEDEIMFFTKAYKR